MYLHDWTAAGSISAIANFSAVGLQVDIFPNGLNNPTLQLFGWWDSGGTVCQIALNKFPNNAIYIRFQRNPQSRRSSCEAWNTDGVRIIGSSHPYVADSTYTFNGLFVGNSGGAAATFSAGFVRLHSTLVPENSRPPVHREDADRLMEWKFDGSPQDSSSNGWHGTLVSGTASYGVTPWQANPVAKAKTLGSPFWSDWVSLRAGHPARLDGTASYSQADSDSAVSYFWQQLSGPSQLVWSSRSEAKPTIEGLTFGTYRFRLRVTDVSNQSTVTELSVGAVATDRKGVVVSASPNVERLFGPMIAFGKNRWGYADARHLRAVELQPAMFSNSWGFTSSGPLWATKATGTVTYRFSGNGPSPSPACTSITSAISATSTSIPVENASCLSVGSLPTWVMIGNDGYGSKEIVRICSTTATTGPAILGVCYDGRGIPTYTRTVAASAWASGTKIGQHRIEGSGTSFVSDSLRPICPAGAPGPAGSVTYSTGEVTGLSGGSTTITGSGTTWTTSNGVAGGSSYSIRIEATHSGGTPFVFWALITSLNSTTGLTVNRPLPAEIDPSPFPYKIVRTRWWALDFEQTDGRVNALSHLAAGCESETAGFAIPLFEVTPYMSTVQTGMRYTYTDQESVQSQFGPNFYGSGLALRAFYLRSGYQPALDGANQIDNWWVREPALVSGGGIPLLQGGGVIGAIACLALGQCENLDWRDVRKFISRGQIGALGCNSMDTRDSGYVQGWLTLGALFDPDTAQRASWRSALQSLFNRDTNCKQADNSWSNAFGWNNAGPAITFTNGSPIGTGTNIPSSVCHGISSGAATVSGSTLTRVSGAFVTGQKVAISGTRSGQPYTAWLEFSVTDADHLALAAIWPGDDGSVTYVIDNSDWQIAIGTSNDDPRLLRNWSCTWNNSSQITLHSPWDGPTGIHRPYSYVLAGYGQQPYMLGIKTTAMNWAASLVEDPTLAANYANLASLAGNWVRDFGYDSTATKGMFYARVYEACEPVKTPIGTYEFRSPGCDNGLNPASVVAARDLTGETSSALRAAYEADPTPANRNWGDEAYSALWCSSRYEVNPPVTCDSKGEGDNSNMGVTGDGALSGTKWAGFFFGMGMAHQWPAVRVGGADPVVLQTASINTNFNGIAGAASVRVTVRSPSGAAAEYDCTSSPCIISVDRRQGAHTYTLEYRSGSGGVLARSAPHLIRE